MDEALALFQAPHEEDVERPVPQLVERLRGRVALDVHPVRDDSVVPREVAADEVAGRAGDRDAALKLCGQLGGPTLPDPVARTEAAKGVEGRDVHDTCRVRLVQHCRRQERDERLVKVKDVEPMLRQQLTGLFLEAPAKGYAAHAAVGGECPAGSQPDDVPLALPLLAVLAGDDPRVMTQAPQLLVLVPHVVVDAARVGISIGADQGDLQRAARTGGRGLAIPSHRFGLAAPDAYRGDRICPLPLRTHAPRVSPLIATLLRARSRGADGAPSLQAAAGTRPRCATRSNELRRPRALRS